MNLTVGARLAAPGLDLAKTAKIVKFIITAMKITNFAGYIWQVEEVVGPGIPLHVHLVKGPEYSVLIDSGLKSSFEAVKALLVAAEVEPERVRLLFNTHAHHDHIGSNGRVKDLTGCLIGAHPGAVGWIEDHERNFIEFCCAFPDLFPDSPALRQEIAASMDEPATRVDLRVRDGFEMSLGEGRAILAWEVPGHMPAELAFFEPHSATLIIGDAITGTDFPFFHGHLDVAAYRRTISRLRTLRRTGVVDRVLPAHYPPLAGPDFDRVLDRVDSYLTDIDSAIFEILKEAPSGLRLEQVWRELCRRFGKELEWRGLAMTEAHLKESVASGRVGKTGPVYSAL
jgi:glyoxylase-like metal-dependent hydrolase (beta-lactamase superfamily II)